MSNIETLIANAVNNAEITDFIMIVRGKCYTLISVEDFIKDITFGGQAVCDTLLNCWKSMGQFDGGTNPENGDDDECSCSDDFVKIHFPKGEGIKIITSEEYTKVADSIYIQTVGSDKYKQVVVDEDGNVREMQLPDIPEVDYPVIDGKSSSDYGTPIYDGLGSDKKIKMLPVSSGQINITKKTTEDGKEYLDFDIPETADDTIKSYFVNENYGNGGNGSPLRPYNNLARALSDIIGTGTNLNPQFKNAIVTLQTNITVTQSQLNAFPKLENSLSVNTTTIKSDGNYVINYSGSLEYPVSTEFLKNKAVANPGIVSQVYFTFSNIQIFTETVKGLGNMLVYQDLNVNVTFILSNVTFGCNYLASSYQSFSPPEYLFGTEVKYQINSISNTSPTLLIRGFNNGGTGGLITGYIKVIGSSQTFLRVEGTGLSSEKTILENNPYLISINNLTDKKPKSGIYRLEHINAWFNTILESGEQNSNYGGQDSFVRYVDDGSYSGSNLIINEGFINSSIFNKILTINNTSSKIPRFNKCDFGNAISLESAILNENGTSVTKEIYLEDSKINNVKKPSESGIHISSTQSFVNGSVYKTPRYFANNADALAAGLIPGNYYTDLTNIDKRVI